MHRLAVLTVTALVFAGGAQAQGVPVNDSGLTAQDIIETGDREADLAIQRDKLAVDELLTAIECPSSGFLGPMAV